MSFRIQRRPGVSRRNGLVFDTPVPALECGPLLCPVLPEPDPLALAFIPDAPAAPNVIFTGVLEATGGIGPYAFANFTAAEGAGPCADAPAGLEALPVGWTLDPSTGELSSVAALDALGGTFTTGFEVTDANDVVSCTYVTVEWPAA